MSADGILAVISGVVALVSLSVAAWSQLRLRRRDSEHFRAALVEGDPVAMRAVEGYSQTRGGHVQDPRWRYGLWAVIAGFFAILVAIGLAMFRFGTAADAVAVAAPAIAAIGTLAGSYFGVQAGASARERRSQEQEPL